MILSMTGFGRGTAVRNGREITVELRSVNSRYFEYSSRIPRTCKHFLVQQFKRTVRNQRMINFQEKLRDLQRFNILPELRVYLE